eukprot:7278272-Pyramimonas_sp.AAC.1
MDGGRFLFKMWRSPQRRAHSISKCARTSRTPMNNVPEMASGLCGCNSHDDSRCRSPKIALWHDSGSSRRSSQ